MFQGVLWWKPSWRKYFLVNGFSSFHPNNFRNTTSWQKFREELNNKFRPILSELESYGSQNTKILTRSTWMHRVMMQFPCIMNVWKRHQDAENVKSIVVRIFVYRDPQDWHSDQNTLICCAIILQGPGVNPELMMECKLIAHPKRWMYWKKVARKTTLSCKARIIETASKMTLRSSEVQDCSWRISTILVSFLVSFSSCHAPLPLIVRPLRTVWEMFLKIIFHSPEMNRSIIVSR